MIPKFKRVQWVCDDPALPWLLPKPEKIRYKFWSGRKRKAKPKPIQLSLLD